MIQDAVSEMVPEMPSNRPAPADSFVEIFAAPIPPGTAPAAVVPTKAVALEPVVFVLGKIGIAAAGGRFLRARPCRARHISGHPSLAFQIIALRQYERRPRSGIGAIDRDTQSRRGNH